MTPGVSLEILDLRHFSAALLRPLLEVEGELWRDRLHWDYRSSTRLLMQYLDGRMLPGYAALDEGQVTGYCFCVYEETKAVIGDVFAVPRTSEDAQAGKDQDAREIESTLLKHLLETLQNSPHVDRVESQLLLHPSKAHSVAFVEAGFTEFRRLFMVQMLMDIDRDPVLALPEGLEIRTWRDDDMNPAGKLISEAYANHPDSLINDQYRSVHGSLRFLHNIVRYSGCGAFLGQVSRVLIDRRSREMVGLVLGSRVSAESGHITQLCVKPDYRGMGLGRALLKSAATAFWRQGMSEVSLTVTEANARAIALYRSEGYDIRHTFDAAVWERHDRVVAQ